MTDSSKTPPLIRRLHAQRFGCLQDVEVELSALHALIGPNDSGKTTLLRALRGAVRLARGQPAAPDKSSVKLFSDPPDPTKLTIDFGVSPVSMKAIRAGSHMECRFRQQGRPDFQFSVEGAIGFNADNPTVELRSILNREERLLRLDPDSLRMQSKLIPDGDELSVFSERGTGLAGVFDAIRNGSSDAARSIDEEMRRLFPTVRRLGLKNVDASTKALRIELIDGRLIDAELMSEGMLYFLAFLALKHVALPCMLLIEEPENGLHPARIKDVVRVLREISRQTQVVLATHSPLVINELQGDEVTVLTRDPKKGTIAQRLDQTPNFAERSKVYALGELWVSYADGDREQPLLQPDK